MRKQKRYRRSGKKWHSTRLSLKEGVFPTITSLVWFGFSHLTALQPDLQTLDIMGLRRMEYFVKDNGYLAL
jgi:hypothetical protein